MLSNTFLDFISDMVTTDHKHYNRWYRKYSRESSTSGIPFKKLVLLEVSYFARNIYEMETITLVLWYIEDLTSLENNIVWFWNSLEVSSQLIVQWNNVIYFHIRGSFLTTFCTSFSKRVHNSKEIVTLQGFFVLTVIYVDIKTYPLTKYYYIIERVYLF